MDANLARFATPMTEVLGLGSVPDRDPDKTRLEAAIRNYRETLGNQGRGRTPIDRGAICNNLGNVLRKLAEQETGTERIEEAIAAYREALSEYRRDRSPLGWAMTQNNLGAALRALGAREGGT